MLFECNGQVVICTWSLMGHSLLWFAVPILLLFIDDFGHLTNIYDCPRMSLWAHSFTQGFVFGGHKYLLDIQNHWIWPWWMFSIAQKLIFWFSGMFKQHVQHKELDYTKVLTGSQANYQNRFLFSSKNFISLLIQKLLNLIYFVYYYEGYLDLTFRPLWIIFIFGSVCS